MNQTDGIPTIGDPVNRPAPAHVCRLQDPWPTGHPLPPEDPAKLQGPEVGEEVIYHHVSRWGTQENGQTVWREKVEDQPARVKARSYVWSPGECRHKGGYRRYDWTVIETFGDGRWYSVVVDDKDLRPVTESA